MSMEKEFEIVEHTSEVGFRAFGETVEQAFENAGKATFSLMKPLEDFDSEKELEFSIEAESLEALLYDWIEHLIYLRDSEQLLFKEFTVEIEEDKGGYRLEAEVRGEDLKGMSAQDVKAVTYSDMEVKQTEDGYMLRVLLDV
ncbi:MAG: archease [Candidatus Nanohaloarchaea archaeon]|nr:archease [Candidatus Nanohaloarchaea archaeon]